jgi:EpsD family peptidyl-prolyl cis-trans isomerase
MLHFGRVLFLVLFSTAFLSACGHKKEGGETQVVAKINGDEITVHQLNYAMARIGEIPKGQEDETGNQVLKNLVDQQMLVKLAVDKKLNRNPNVLQAIEASKSQILAQAALEQLVQPLLTKPTDTEIHDYYVKSPELFTDRRIYKFAEISIAGTDQIDKIKHLLSGTKSLEEFAGKLRKENIEFKTAPVVKAAEELPTALLPKFSRMAKGEVAIIPIGDSLTVLQLQDFKEQPVAEEQAKPLIGKFLFEQKRKALLEAEMQKLRDAAKIEYLGAYADAGKARQSPAATQPASAVNAASPQAEPGKVDATKDSNMKKGLSGL